MSNLAGKTILQYKIIEQVGQGGMGVVYKAHDTKLDRTVALKFLPLHINVNDTDKERFLQEAKAAAALNHPNVCVIHDIQEYEKQQFIIMEYVDGKTLRLKVQDRRMEINEAIEVAIQIGEALQEAHSKGIVHRDVKSDNIMITATNQVKVMDFGLAKLKGSLKLTKTSSTVGTLAYMAPEQIQGGGVDARSDIFSFGVVLYEMLTGQFPFKGDYEAALMYSILNEQPEPIEKHIPDISSELLHVINRVLEKNTENRYQSMKDMLIDLRRLKRDTIKIPKITKEYYKSEKTIKEKNKFKKYIIPLAVIFLITISVIGYIFTIYDSGEEYERIPIAVIDFVNETNEPELNGLSGMLITALEQSRRLSVLTRSRMFDVLKQLKIEDTERIDESLGRKICKQADINSLAMASIRKFGNVYTVDLKVLNVEKNEYLFTTKEQGEGQESIPAMIDNLSEKTRKGLKEKADEIQAASQKVADVTTQNLEAYLHYFKGEEYINKLKFEKAEEEYKKAIALDSTFGLAYYRLAYALDWEQNQIQAKKQIEKAVKYIDQIPGKEKYLVRAVKTIVDSGWGEAALKILREMEKVYPNDKEMLYNIGDISYHLSDYQVSKNYLEKVIEIDPNFVRALQHLTLTYRDLGLSEKILEVAKRYVDVSESEDSYNLLAEAYMLTGEFETGLKSLKQIQELHPDRYYLSGSIAIMYYLQEQYDEAEKELKVLVEKDKPVEMQRLGNKYLAGFYPYVGKYREAIQACDKVIDFYWQSKDTSLASYWQLGKGWSMISGWNDVKAAWKEVEKTFPLQKQIDYPFYWTSLTWLYISHGDYVLADRLAANFADAKWWHLAVRSLIHIEKQECNKAESLADTVLQIGTRYGKILVLYPLAECHFEQGQLDKSEKYLFQLQRIYDNRFGVRARYYPKSFYLLGKIYEKKGDRNLALKNYKKFLKIWKNADKDLPELIDAKKRLADLAKEI